MTEIYMVVALVVLAVAGWEQAGHWHGKTKALREELAQERADRTIKDANGTEPLQQACQLHIAEIKRLEAERDALREQVEQVKLRRSEGSKRGWQKRRAA